MSKSPESKQDVKVARELLRYQLQRPHARDSIEALAGWWVRRQRIDESVRTVRRVVTWLVSESLMRKYDDPPGYGLNEARLDDVIRFVNE